MRTQLAKPWLCMGDFNEVLLSHEKIGGRPWSQACMDKFREALEYCQLEDLGFEGYMFTWRNHNHVADEYIKERLDQAVANDLWRGWFIHYRVFNGDPRHSDHRPVIVNTDRPAGKNNTSRRTKPFQFEANWLGEEKCACQRNGNEGPHDPGLMHD